MTLSQNNSKTDSRAVVTRIILGIDPGSRITGFGVIALENRHYRYISCGCIYAGKGKLLPRLRKIHQGISELLKKYTINEVAIEQIFVRHNVQSALKLAQARGAALTAIASYHDLSIGFAEYTPRMIKKAVVGYGAADKKQVQHMVQQLLNLSGMPSVDAADALAIALCHTVYRDENTEKINIERIAC